PSGAASRASSATAVSVMTGLRAGDGRAGRPSGPILRTGGRPGQSPPRPPAGASSGHDRRATHPRYRRPPLAPPARRVPRRVPGVPHLPRPRGVPVAAACLSRAPARRRPHPTAAALSVRLLGALAVPVRLGPAGAGVRPLAGAPPAGKEGLTHAEPR